VAGCAIVAAFGVARPLTVAVVLVWAIAIAGVLPLTPGNLGVGAGAAGVALHTMGVGVDTALALGLAFQAAETAAGVSLGLVGAVVVSAPRTHTRRLAVAGVTACALAAATFGIAGLDLV
jgi:hypothetical protein